jgi:hypothetical protein
MILASPSIADTNEPYRYDLINTGREVLAQLTGPVGMNFSDTIKVNSTATAAEIKQTGDAYQSLLNDIDTLVGTDQAFLLYVLTIDELYTFVT